MRTLSRLAITTLLLLAASACTDAQRGKWGALGSKATVTCYSGGTAFYTGRSTGKVSPEDGGAGYFLRDSARAKLVEVSGQCLVEYDPQ